MIFDPRCAPADPSLVDLVASELSDAALTNSTIIDADPYTFFGATTLRQDGSMSNRSDVWIIDGGALYASSCGARNEGTRPKARTALGVSPCDEAVQAVDGCVIGITTGR
ncbi:hypothetical protein [Rhodococcus sovatensis]|uniref:Uncharacterized protein n=1 Tax=Rhodococcus sovatensis TaxID=1805840 RepID=A0ABZ2PRZ4_9NOCA